MYALLFFQKMALSHTHMRYPNSIQESSFYTDIKWKCECIFGTNTHVFCALCVGSVQCLLSYTIHAWVCAYMCTCICVDMRKSDCHEFKSFLRFPFSFFTYVFCCCCCQKASHLTRNSANQSREEYRTVHPIDNMINVIDVRRCSLRLQQSAKINKLLCARKLLGHSIKLARQRVQCLCIEWILNIIRNVS